MVGKGAEVGERSPGPEGGGVAAAQAQLSRSKLLPAFAFPLETVGLETRGRKPCLQHGDLTLPFSRTLREVRRGARSAV